MQLYGAPTGYVKTARVDLLTRSEKSALLESLGAYRGPIGQNKLGDFFVFLIFLKFFMVFLGFIFFLNG